MMTAGERRKARKAARADGSPFAGDLATAGHSYVPAPPRRRRYTPRERYATRAEQRERYLDCGPQAWDDR